MASMTAARLRLASFAGETMFPRAFPRPDVAQANSGLARAQRAPLLLRTSGTSRLPTPVHPWVDVATGSLGQGLPIGVGMALAGKYLDRLPYRTWVLCGDSETAEGSIWEAFEHAAHYELDNLTAILDVNRLGQRGETMVGWDVDIYRDRAHAFGWETIEIDGHDAEAIDRAYTEAAGTTGKPTVVIARTIKGKGVKAVENQPGWHGKPLDDPDEAIAELGRLRSIRVHVAKPETADANTFPSGTLQLPRYDLGEEVATRKAYGEALA